MCQVEIMKKRFTACLTTLILSVFFSISASADVVEVDGIYYDISENNATVTQYEDYSGRIVIPESITFYCCPLNMKSQFEPIVVQ